jgi:peptidoglycan/LPS O-acetylase OafA/YrhL
MTLSSLTTFTQADKVRNAPTTEMTKKPFPSLIGIDLLRFCLSIAVILRHYYHFYYPFTKDENEILANEPFHRLLSTFYAGGGLAVQFFWLISGFIFYYVYDLQIRDNKIRFGAFCLLRFSRLYPLHLLTLVIVALLQIVFYQLHHNYFVYPDNGIRNFFLNVFFVSGWSEHFDFSFNVPIWSVSVEIFVYLIFYCLTRLGFTAGKKLYVILPILLLSHFLGVFSPFHDCLLYFFSGSLLARLMYHNSPQRLIGVYLICFVFLAGCILIMKRVSIDYNIIYSLKVIVVASLSLLCFIFVVNALKIKRLLRLSTSLGNLSYSMYLIHFPIQIGIFLLLSPKNYLVFNSPWMLLSFMTITIFSGWLLYRFFERNTQDWIRARWLHKV